MVWFSINSDLAVDAARDKFATRAIMADAGLATPANCLIEKAADLEAAAATVGFPAVIKPIAGAGSMGVVRVDSAEELARIYKKVVADMGRAVVTSGALVYAPESGGTGASSKARSQRNDAKRHSNPGSLPLVLSRLNTCQAFDVVMMMEQYLDGAEVDVDVVLSEGVAVYSEVTDNWPTIEPYFQEVGANCPSQLTAVQQAELVELSVAATLSLGAPRLRGCMFVRVSACTRCILALLTRVCGGVQGSRAACSTWRASTRRTAHD
jgi:carnosine synthase